MHSRSLQKSLGPDLSQMSLTHTVQYSYFKSYDKYDAVKALGNLVIIILWQSDFVMWREHINRQDVICDQIWENPPHGIFC